MPDDKTALDLAAIRKDCLMLIRDAGHDPVAFCQQLGDDFLAALPHLPFITAAEQKAGHAIIEQQVNQTLNS